MLDLGNLRLASIYIKRFVSQSVRLSVCDVLFVPGGQTICLSPGGQTFFVGGGGGFDDVDEEIDVSKANFPVSEANILVSEVSKLSVVARIGP